MAIFLQTFSEWHFREKILPVLFLGIAAYYTYLVFYRWYLHPLSQFPGPRIATATFLYEFYWDYFRHGGYVYEIERMHKKYVTPEGLSVHDPEFYTTLYVPGGVRRTEACFGEGLGFEGAHGVTVDHDHHRLRRKPLESFFSRAGIGRIEPMLQSLVASMIEKLEAHRGTGRIIRADHMFTAFSGDVEIGVCVGSSTASLLSGQDFSPQWQHFWHSGVPTTPLFIMFPWVLRLILSIPPKILARINPSMQALRERRTVTERFIIEAKQRKQRGDPEGSGQESLKSNTVFDYLLSSDLPESELTVGRLTSEGQLLIGGGTSTTAHTLGYLLVHILKSEKVHQKLQDELQEVIAGLPDKAPPLKTLENLPYLQACITEGLRLSYGLMMRLSRSAPDTALQYKEWVIPPRTSVGMSAYLMHTDPDVFPEPFEFKPDRWIGDIDPRRHRNFVPFAKGSRSCLGRHLARAQLSMVIAALFCKAGPNLKLYDTDESAVDPVYAYAMPLARNHEKGVKVVVF